MTYPHGIYIHIPFCVRKCLYCDFLSFPASVSVSKDYLYRLCDEIRLRSLRFRKDNSPSDKSAVRTVFIGGGTPTVLDSMQLALLLDTVRDSFKITPDAEISIEANPGTIDSFKARSLRLAGYNRLSLGLESADDEELCSLGRIHSADDFKESFKAARDAGFDNINVDLIYDLPGQTPDSFRRTLDEVLRLCPEHISAYDLILEKGTPFFDRYHTDYILRSNGGMPSLLPSEDEAEQMDALIRTMLSEAGYHRYEISNYSLRGYECRHNVGYWTGADYLGLGLGASSLLSSPEKNTAGPLNESHAHRFRLKNTSDLSVYLESDFDFSPAESCPLNIQAQMEEFMFLGLRMIHGVSLSDFKRRFHVSAESVYGEQLRSLVRQGLIKAESDRVMLTDAGLNLSNRVLADFII